MYRCRQWQSQVVEMQEVGNAPNPNLARCTFWYSGHYDDDCDGGDDGGGHYDDDDDCDGGHYDNQNLSRFPNLLLCVLAYDDSVYCVFLDPDLTSVKVNIVFQLNLFLFGFGEKRHGSRVTC